MRGFIRLCSGTFVVLGMATVALAAVVALRAFSLGADPNATTMGLSFIGAGLIAAVVGFFAGASLTLVGGATYLLASIDYRLELAAKITKRAKINPEQSFGVGDGVIPIVL
jgi:hypothetical protein